MLCGCSLAGVMGGHTHGRWLRFACHSHRIPGPVPDSEQNMSLLMVLGKFETEGVAAAEGLCVQHPTAE